MRDLLQRYLEEHRRLLTVLLFVLLGNVLFYVVLTGPLKLRASALGTKRATADEDLQKALGEYGKARLETRLIDAAAKRMDDLGGETLRTRKERYEVVDVAIRDILRKFQASPQSINYSWTTLKSERLEQLKISFNIKGTYLNLRHFLSAIEQAQTGAGQDLFFAIESVSLTDSTDDGSELNLNVQVATYFSRPELAIEEAETDRKAARTRRGA